ncbi:hypothetical protein LY76DRAFT_393764 [Colletotrichum caudatum]|nr:hypothetical protein LY76DRAFT_393764 [Colletotrichum caudatum]
MEETCQAKQSSCLTPSLAARGSNVFSEGPVHVRRFPARPTIFADYYCSPPEPPPEPPQLADCISRLQPKRAPDDQTRTDLSRISYTTEFGRNRDSTSLSTSSIDLRCFASHPACMVSLLPPAPCLQSGGGGAVGHALRSKTGPLQNDPVVPFRMGQ